MMAKPQPVVPGTQSTTVQATVKDMQGHYAKTGVFRSADLNRVLGDTKQRAGATLAASYSTNARKK
jgi:hypothetical protein